MKPARRESNSEVNLRLHLVTTTPPLSNAVIPSEAEGSQHFASVDTTARHSPLALWHLLSLDAPTVATLWTYFIAHTAGIMLQPQACPAMFLAVWILYAADRLLDARPALGDQELEERHRFHHQHRSRFLLGITLAAPVLALFLYRLPAAALHLYVLLATLLAAWLLLIHARSVESHRLPKELAVGICFPAAVFIPTVANAPQLRLTLLAPALCFAAVCTLNCLFVYAWEHPGPRTNAHPTTRWGTHHLPTLASAALVVCILAAVAFPHFRSLPLACALSVTCFLVLHKRRFTIAPVHLRALADAALLTPLLFFLAR